MGKIISKYESLLDELDLIEEAVIWENASGTLQNVGDDLEDKIIILNAKLRSVLFELKEKENE